MVVESLESKVSAPSKSILTEFAAGVFHGALENPLNASIQVANHLVGAEIPELHLVDAKRINESTAG